MGFYSKILKFWQVYYKENGRTFNKETSFKIPRVWAPEIQEKADFVEPVGGVMLLPLYKQSTYRYTFHFISTTEDPHHSMGETFGNIMLPLLVKMELFLTKKVVSVHFSHSSKDFGSSAFFFLQKMCTLF